MQLNDIIDWIINVVEKLMQCIQLSRAQQLKHITNIFSYTSHDTCLAQLPWLSSLLLLYFQVFKGHLNRGILPRYG